MERPDITKSMQPTIFNDYYYLKEELVRFCKTEGLPTTGNKKELTERIDFYLRTGEVKKKPIRKKANSPEIITLETTIEENITCSEVHRQFFKAQLGETFTFKVAFQNWLKNNAGKKYEEAVNVYPELVSKKPKKIDAQFEYNTYIRDFFLENSGLTLKDAIACWKHKKSQPGHNKYETSDLEII